MAHAIMEIGKLKRGNLASAYAHNARDITTLNADKDNLSLNEELIKQNEDISYEELVQEKLKSLEAYQKNPPRKDAVYALEIILTFSNEIKEKIDVREWAEKNIEWLRQEFNRNPEKYGDNIVSVKLHSDESTPHLHAIVVPIDDKGKLNAYEYIHGPVSLRELQTSYGKAMAEFGLERGIEYSVAKHTDIKKFYAGINEALKERAPEIKPGETIEHYKARADKAFKNEALKLYAQTTKMQEKLTEERSKEHRNTTLAKLELKEAKKELKKAKKELDELEHEFGSVKEIKEELREHDALLLGLEQHPDENYAQDMLREIENIARLGKQLREREQEEERRKRRHKKKTFVSPRD